MMTIQAKKLETELGIDLLHYPCYSMGVDTASRTGWCRATYVDKKNIAFNFGFIDIKATDTDGKYRAFIDTLGPIIRSLDPKYHLIVEDAWLSFGARLNPKTFQFLSRFGGIAYAWGYEAGLKDVRFLGPTSARAKLGVNASTKKAKELGCKTVKKAVQQQFKEKLNIELDDSDIVDAMILAICGLIKE